MPFTRLSILALLTPLAFAQTKMVTLATKQAIENVRFISSNGNVTYYQKSSGALNLSTLYKSNDILQGPAGTNYYVQSSPSRKKIVVEVEKDRHENMDLNKLHDIMTGPYLGTSLQTVGRGRVPRLHLDDEWMTWYDPHTKLIHVQFLAMKDRHYVIKLGNKHNPFFFPEVVMLNPETILYTDINDQGFAALLSWNLVEKNMTVVQKAKYSGTRMEICRNDNYVALGEFSYDSTDRGTLIQVLAWKEGVPSLQGFTAIYRNHANDLGQMICSKDRIWFVRTFSDDRKTNNLSTDAVSYELGSNKLERMSTLERVTNIFNMDGRILVPFREEVYVLTPDNAPKGKSP